MGEIKSTLELAMERTKRFAVSEKEKEDIKQKEILRKAAGLFHRHREGSLSLNDILKEIGGMEGKTATTAKEHLLSLWIGALSLDDDSERILKGVELLKGKSIAGVKQEFRHLVSKYQREREKIKEKVGGQMRGALEESGIWGSAVEPKLDGSELWNRENENLEQVYKMTLEEIKQQLRVS